MQKETELTASEKVKAAIQERAADLEARRERLDELQAKLDAAENAQKAAYDRNDVRAYQEALRDYVSINTMLEFYNQKYADAESAPLFENTREILDQMKLQQRSIADAARQKILPLLKEAYTQAQAARDAYNDVSGVFPLVDQNAAPRTPPADIMGIIRALYPFADDRAPKLPTFED